jgi:hypothetical protein
MKDLDENSSTLHTVMSYVIIGNLTMARCYVDWGCDQNIMAGKDEA